MSVLSSLTQNALRKESFFLPSTGKIRQVRGPLVVATMPYASIGDLAWIRLRNGSELPAQIIAFENELTTLAPFDVIDGIYSGAEVRTDGSKLSIPVGEHLRGKIVDALGGVISGEILPSQVSRQSVHAPSPNPLLRRPIQNPLCTGIRSIDGLCTIGYGQRLGLFAPAGLGKSTLLGFMASNADVDVTVVGMVGERGREVLSFLDDALGDEGRKNAVVVVATSDESAARRMLAPLTATTIAEYFRDKGQRVLLLIDSLTRTARAIREVGFAAGEIPIRGGYTPSVYSELPRLLERAGNNEVGSITAIYTMLTAAEDESDPLAEEVKSLLDGHITLTQEMIRQGVRPAIDPLQSISRLFSRFHSQEYVSQSAVLIRMLGKLRKEKDMLLFGGTPDEELRRCLDLEPQLLLFLNQPASYCGSMEDTKEWVRKLVTSFLEKQEKEIVPPPFFTRSVYEQ